MSEEKIDAGTIKTARPTIASTNKRLDEFESAVMEEQRRTDEKVTSLSNSLTSTTFRLSMDVGRTARESFESDVYLFRAIQSAIVLFTTVLFLELFSAVGSMYSNSVDCFLIGLKIFLMLFIYYKIQVMGKARARRFTELFVNFDEPEED